VLGKHGGDRRSERVDQDGNYHLETPRGSSAAYTLARLRRDGRPLAGIEVPALLVQAQDVAAKEKPEPGARAEGEDQGGKK